MKFEPTNYMTPDNKTTFGDFIIRYELKVLRNIYTTEQIEQSDQNSNFVYDGRNNIDNCRFVPIFDKYKEITFINRYHNIFDEKVSKFVTSDLLKSQIEEEYNDKLMKLDKEDKIYEIKLQTFKTERVGSLEAAEKIDQKNKKNKKRATLVDYVDRKNEALTNQRVKILIDFDEEYSCSIRSIAIEKI